MSDEINVLRERVAVTEATLRAVNDTLGEMKDAVVGINASLHVLTRLEERIVALHEHNSTTRQLIIEERKERRDEIVTVEQHIKDERVLRQEQAGAFGERIGNLEILMGEVDNQTTLNSHGRGMWEKVIPILVAAIIGPALTIFLTLQFMKPDGP